MSSYYDRQIQAAEQHRTNLEQRLDALANQKPLTDAEVQLVESVRQWGGPADARDAVKLATRENCRGGHMSFEQALAIVRNQRKSKRPLPSLHELHKRPLR